MRRKIDSRLHTVRQTSWKQSITKTTNSNLFQSRETILKRLIHLPSTNHAYKDNIVKRCSKSLILVCLFIRTRVWNM